MTALLGLSNRLRVAKLHLVTDTRRAQGDLPDFLAAALRGGVDMVQIRDSAASVDELVAAMDVAQNACQQLNATAVVGQHQAVAHRINADVLHLGAADGAVHTARMALPEHSLVGRSVHHSADLAHVEADYLFVGPCYDLDPRDDVSVPGLGIVAEAARRLPVQDPAGTPWFAVGGITEANLDEVLAAGAMRVAVSGAITEADDPEVAATRIKARLQAAWDARPEMERYAISALGGGTARFIGQ